MPRGRPSAMDLIPFSGVSLIIPQVLLALVGVLGVLASLIEGSLTPLLVVPTLLDLRYAPTFYRSDANPPRSTAHSTLSLPTAPIHPPGQQAALPQPTTSLPKLEIASWLNPLAVLLLILVVCPAACRCC
ncbi:hypothetical protein V2W45_607557 [Cenococcum geophilum]